MRQAGLIRGACRFFVAADGPGEQGHAVLSDGLFELCDQAPVVDVETLGGASAAALPEHLHPGVDIGRLLIPPTPGR